MIKLYSYLVVEVFSLHKFEVVFKWVFVPACKKNLPVCGNSKSRVPCICYCGKLFAFDKVDAFSNVIITSSDHHLVLCQKRKMVSSCCNPKSFVKSTSGSHVAEYFYQIKLFPSLFRKTNNICLVQPDLSH